MLVALKVFSIAPHFQDHVFHTAAAGEHAVGGLEEDNTYKYTVLLDVQSSISISFWAFVS